MDITNWACLDCEQRFTPADPHASEIPCPHCGGDFTFAVVSITEIRPA